MHVPETGTRERPVVEDRVGRREKIDQKQVSGVRRLSLYVSCRFASSCSSRKCEEVGDAGDQSGVRFRSRVCDSIVILLLYMK